MAGNALKKIVARVKQLRKKHPNAKYKTLQKQAGREFKAGKLKAKRKPATKKKTVRRKASRKKSTGRKVGAVRVQTVKIAAVKKHKKRRKPVKKTYRKRARVGATSSLAKLLIPAVGLGLLGFLAYKMMQPATNQQGLINRNSTAAAQGQSNVLQWAAAAGIVGGALAKIIDSLNSSDDATVAAAGSSPAAAQNYWSNFLSGD